LKPDLSWTRYPFVKYLIHLSTPNRIFTGFHTCSLNFIKLLLNFHSTMLLALQVLWLSTFTFAELPQHHIDNIGSEALSRSSDQGLHCVCDTLTQYSNICSSLSIIVLPTENCFWRQNCFSWLSSLCQRAKRQLCLLVSFRIRDFSQLQIYAHRLKRCF